MDETGPEKDRPRCRCRSGPVCVRARFPSAIRLKVESPTIALNPVSAPYGFGLKETAVGVVSRFRFVSEPFQIRVDHVGLSLHEGLYPQKSPFIFVMKEISQDDELLIWDFTELFWSNGSLRYKQRNISTALEKPNLI